MHIFSCIDYWFKLLFFFWSTRWLSWSLQDFSLSLTAAVTHVQHALLNSKQLGRFICIRWVEHLQTCHWLQTDKLNSILNLIGPLLNLIGRLGCRMKRANTTYLLELWEDFKFLAEMMLRDRTASAAESSTSGLFLIRPTTDTTIKVRWL